MIENLMSKYTTENLVNMPAKEFEAGLTNFLGRKFAVEASQRRFETEFVWGHYHDFGSFELEGQMGTRHIQVLEALLGMGVNFEGSILDIGVWTGGTSLLLAAMGCRVYAIEEIAPYIEALNFMANAFGIEDELTGIPLSVYDLPPGEVDMVLCAGVLYHLSDPLYALRKMFESLKDGGEVLIETAFRPGLEAIMYYKRGGPGNYTWYVPTPVAVKQMLEDVGFVDVKYTMHSNRLVARAFRREYKPMIIAGTRLRGEYVAKL